VVGFTRHARADEMAAASNWRSRSPRFRRDSPSERASLLRRAADMLEARNDLLIGLIVREAGKSYANAVAEVREAADFLRYYGHEAARTLLPGSPSPLGLVVCISPWNFPLAIFTGQVAAALAAGNSVIAKPAKRRRSSPPRPSARCTRRAFRAMRCSSYPAQAKLARRWSQTPAFRESCSPARLQSHD